MFWPGRGHVPNEKRGCKAPNSFQRKSFISFSSTIPVSVLLYSHKCTLQLSGSQPASHHQCLAFQHLPVVWLNVAPVPVLIHSWKIGNLIPGYHQWACKAPAFALVIHKIQSLWEYPLPVALQSIPYTMDFLLLHFAPRVS